MIKNITIVTQYFAPAWSYGGPPRVLFTLARQLINQGINIKVITTDVLDENRNTFLSETLDGVEITRFKTISNYLAYKMKLIIVPRLLEKSKKIILQSDFVLFSDIRAIINWQLYSLVYNTRIPYGIFAFGEIPYDKGIKSPVKKIMDLLWVKDFVKKATFRFAQTLHEQKMYNVYFGIPLNDSQLLSLPIDRNQQKIDDSLFYKYRKKWGIHSDDQVILFVGRLHYLKGIDLIISAVTPLFRDNPHLKLLIVGRNDGEESKLRTFISQELENRVIFTGPLYEKEALCAYALASCFVITPRYYEETSLASLEALSHGVPVIATREADIPYLEEYQAGYIVNNNSDSIRKAVIRILEKVTKDKKKVKENSLKLISDKFSASMVAGNLSSIIGIS